MTHHLAIVGAGKMGHAVAALAPERGFEVVATLDVADNPEGHGITRDALHGAEVAIDFTVPGAAAANVRAAVDAGCPIVVGTTGWYGELPAVSQFVREKKGALLTAPNFSIGVNVFAEVVAHAAKLLGAVGFDAHMIETHHTAKKDAPSGTALMLAKSAQDAGAAAMPITSVRVGAVPGTHEVVFDAAFEQVRLLHEARDRRVFAEGALLAARWLIGRTGVFTMRDVIAQPMDGTRS